jgi:hypothetical protein
MTDKPTALPTPGQPLTDDLPCSRCGYNLRGLTLEKLCPECATPIARSAHGNLVQYADPDWVDRLRFGTALMLWNMLIGLVVGGAGVVILAIGLPQVLISLLTLVAGGMGLWAMFLITTPEPANALSEDPMTLRKLVRGCAIINFLGTVLQEAGKTGGLGPAVLVAGGVMLLVGIVAHFGFFVYLRRFALRIPDDSLAAQTRTVMWGLVIGMVLLALTGIVAVVALGATAGLRGAAPVAGTPTAPAAPPAPPGPLASLTLGAFGCGGGLALVVFGIWYIVLLFLYHGAFKEAVQLGRQKLHTPTAAPAQPVEPTAPPPSDPNGAP